MSEVVQSQSCKEELNDLTLEGWTAFNEETRCVVTPVMSDGLTLALPQTLFIQNRAVLCQWAELI